METRSINPSPWLLEYGVNHGVEVTGAQRVLYLSGQTSTAYDGTPKHEGDFVAQFKFAWENLLKALDEAGMNPSNLVRLNLYTTDVDALFENDEELFGLFSQSGCKLTCTVLGVTRLYLPSIMIEMEGTAVA